MDERPDPFHFERFVSAQDSVFDTVLAELRAGRKRSHWMWFVFPQLAGLGTSANATYFAISGLQEAAAYLQHPFLGPRLIECTELVAAYEVGTLVEALGRPDDVKFHSSVTLFSLVTDQDSCFHTALAKHFPGGPDQRTLQLLRESGGAESRSGTD